MPEAHDPRQIVLERARRLTERDTPAHALWLLAEFMLSLEELTDWIHEQLDGDDDRAAA